MQQVKAVGQLRSSFTLGLFLPVQSVTSVSIEWDWGSTVVTAVDFCVSIRINLNATRNLQYNSNICLLEYIDNCKTKSFGMLLHVRLKKQLVDTDCAN